MIHDHKLKLSKLAKLLKLPILVNPPKLLQLLQHPKLLKREEHTISSTPLRKLKINGWGVNPALRNKYSPLSYPRTAACLVKAPCP